MKLRLLRNILILAAMLFYAPFNTREAAATTNGCYAGPPIEGCSEVAICQTETCTAVFCQTPTEIVWDGVCS